MSGPTIVAPGVTVTPTSARRITAAAIDLLLAMALVLAIPFAFAVLAALIGLLVKVIQAAAFG